MATDLFADLDALRVHGDLLLEGGDPRGELIAIGFERLRADRPELAAREAELLAAQTARLKTFLPEGSSPKLTWRLGYVDALEVEYNGETPYGLVSVLAIDPVLHQLHRLELNALQWDGDTGDMETIFAELARHAAELPRLVEIVVNKGMDLGNPYIEGPIGIHDVSPLLRAFPQLEILRLEGRDTQLGEAPLVLPRLQHLMVRDLDHGRAFAAAALPSLVDLDVMFAPGEPHARYDPLFDASFPQLRVLAVAGSWPHTPEIIDRLPTSRLARTVRRLGFGRLDKAWVPRLLAHAPWLRTLEAVTIPAHHLPPELRAAVLSELGPIAVFT